MPLHRFFFHCPLSSLRQNVLNVVIKELVLMLAGRKDDTGRSNAVESTQRWGACGFVWKCAPCRRVTKPWKYTFYPVKGKTKLKLITRFTSVMHKYQNNKKKQRQQKQYAAEIFASVVWTCRTKFFFLLCFFYVASFFGWSLFFVFANFFFFFFYRFSTFILNVTVVLLL